MLPHYEWCWVGLIIFILVFLKVCSMTLSLFWEQRLGIGVWFNILSRGLLTALLFWSAFFVFPCLPVLDGLVCMGFGSDV